MKPETETMPYIADIALMCKKRRKAIFTHSGQRSLDFVFGMQTVILNYFFFKYMRQNRHHNLNIVQCTRLTTRCFFL